MPAEENLYKQLLDKDYSKQCIHNVFHKFLLQKIVCKNAYNQLLFFDKLKWRIKNKLDHAPRFQLVNHLTAKGLYMLKTQFAKKPKNPV